VADYGGNLSSHRYSAADQITKDNFNQLQLAWRLKTDFLGPRPDTLYSATPLLIDRVLYTTAGTRRAAVALNAATGEMLWMHTEDEGARGENSPRKPATSVVSALRDLLGVNRRPASVSRFSAQSPPIK
jgi:quinoprotein glucose dehydrogenase